MGYQKIISDAKHLKELSKSDRFVKISAREDGCDLSSATWKTLLSNTYLQALKIPTNLSGIMENKIGKIKKNLPKEDKKCLT